MTNSGSSRPQVAIVGAGFSGLVAAWRLNKDGYDVTIFEKTAKTGGLIQTFQNRNGQVETAANGLLASKLVEELFEDCGVTVLKPRKSARRRYLAVAGEITRFPLTIAEAFSSALKALKAKRHPPTSQESLDSWATRVLGQAMSRKIVATAMLGIYAAEATELSANLIVGRFYDRTRSRNIPGRLRGTVAGPNGMGEFLSTLRQTLESRAVKFVFETDVADGGKGSERLRHFRETGGQIVLATPAWESARILKKLDPASSRIPALELIESIPLISITSYFSRKPLRTGFGTLFCQTAPEGENDGLLGALQNSEIFEGRSSEGIHSETWILGGRKHGLTMISKSDEELIELVLAKRTRLIAGDSRQTHIESVVTKWPTAIPLYSGKLESVRSQLLKDESGIILFGNYLGELGLASILENVRRLGDRVRLT